MIAFAMLLQVAAATPTPSLDSIHNYRRISDRLATSGQMTYEQIADIADAGFEVVVNLAPAREERNGQEGFLVAERGMTYINIPVDWQEPAFRDLEMFFAVMEANKDRRVLVHCFANMRASAFTYLYRTLRNGESEETATPDVAAIWDPASQAQWDAFIHQAQERYRVPR
jgi:uncharacterized protein (TIGR01244 family)